MCALLCVDVHSMLLYTGHTSGGFGDPSQGIDAGP